MSDNVFKVGEMEFEALSDRIIILEDQFRSGYECATCQGDGKVKCDNCGGTGHALHKKCSWCEAGTITCPDCKGKGGVLVVPEVSERRPTTGRVVSIGPKVTTLKVGESVLYSNFAGFLVELNRATNGSSTALRILHEGEVMTKLKGHLKLTDLKARQDIPAFAT